MKRAHVIKRFFFIIKVLAVDFFAVNKFFLLLMSPPSLKIIFVLTPTRA
jgi:hypothetical protein